MLYCSITGRGNHWVHNFVIHDNILDVVLVVELDLVVV